MCFWLPGNFVLDSRQISSPVELPSRFTHRSYRQLSKKHLQKIANDKLARHLFEGNMFHQILILTLLTFFVTEPSGDNLSERERHGENDRAGAMAKSVIAEYHTSDPAAQVHLWKQQITRPSGNPRFAEFQAEQLKEWEASEFAPYRVNDPGLVAQIREIFNPVLQLYNRQNCFAIILIEHPIPIMMNDNGVLMMISTGLIERARSNDEILGHVAHELAHDLHWRRTAKARSEIALCQERECLNTPEAREAREELARIEMECDAFSAVTLSALGRNPTLFGRYLGDTERDYRDYLSPDLPPASLRAKVIAGVSPIAAARVTSHMTEAFRRLKTMLAHHSSART